MSKEIVACRRIVSGRKVRSELARFCDRDARPFGAVGVAGRDQDHAWGDGGDGRLLEAGLTCCATTSAWFSPTPRPSATRRAAKSDANDAALVADLLAHGLIRASFVPPQPIQDLRDLTRTRRELTREIVRHTQRIQATLEEHQAGLGHFRHPGRDAAGAS